MGSFRLFQITGGIALSLSLFLPSSFAQTTRYLDPVFSQIDVTTDIAFSTPFNPMSGMNEVLRMDRYEPSGDLETTRPAIVVVHGGGFLGGDKQDIQYSTLATRLAERGYVAVSINYRVAQSQAQKAANYPLIVTNAAEDFRNAVRHVRQNASTWGVDPDRIATYGASAGATTNLEGSFVQEAPGQAVSGQVQAVVDMWGLLNSLTEMEAGDVPFCVVHGTLDTVVPFTNATDLRDRADQVGVPYSWNAIAGAGHAPWGIFWSTYFDPTLEFLYQYLELAKLSGLVVRSGYASPGTLVLDSFGLAGDTRLLCLSLGEASLPFPPIGTFCLDPSSLIVASVPAFPAGATVTTQTLSVPVPAGISGLSVFFQEVHSEPGGEIRLLTNCVAVHF